MGSRPRPRPSGDSVHRDATRALVDPHLQRALEALDAAGHALSTEGWLRAEPGHWNSAQIVEHLGKAFGSTAYILDKCVTDGAPKARTPSWRQRLFTALVVEVGYFPTGVRAPEMTLPEGLSGPDALAFAREALGALDDAASRAAVRFGARVPIANHPILGGFSVRQWRRFHWMHTRHHVRQIARLRD